MLGAFERLIRGMAPRHAVLGGLVSFSVLTVLVACRLGPEVQWDSTVYASTAESFGRSGHMVDFNGDVLTLFPPGFPAVLGLLVRAGFALSHVVLALNVAAVAAATLLTYLLARRTGASSGMAVASTAVVALSPATLRVYSSMMSEPMFVALALLAIAILAAAAHRGQLTWRQLIIVGLAVSLATTVRFVGFTLIPVVLVGVALACRAQRRARMVGMTAVGGGLSSAGLAAVSARNLVIGAPPMGARSPSGLSVPDVVGDSLRVLGDYVGLGLAGGVLLAGLMLFGLWRIVITRDAGMAVVATFLIAYWAALGYGEMATRIERVGYRMTAPVFPPMVVLVAYAATQLPWSPPSAVRRVGLGLSMAWLGASLLATANLAVVRAVDGAGYAALAITQSPLVHTVRTLPADAGIAAFDAPRVYWTTGRTRIAQVPWTNFYNRSEEAAEQLATLERRVRRGEVQYVVAFAADAYSGGWSPCQLVQAGIPLRVVGVFDDGSLWAVESRPGAARVGVDPSSVSSSSWKSKGRPRESR